VAPAAYWLTLLGEEGNATFLLSNANLLSEYMASHVSKQYSAHSSITRASQLMLFRKIIALYSKDNKNT
jgi:hypothetical protein